MSEPSPHLVEILLVEDNELDAEATMHAAEDSLLANRIHHVWDGQAALDFLFQRGDYSDASRPELILLDLNMPGIDGREVLKQVKSHDQLKTIPVVILTTSKTDEDILSSYQHGANAYIRKPVTAGGFTNVVKTIEEFWFGIVVLPPKE